MKCSGLTVGADASIAPLPDNSYAMYCYTGCKNLIIVVSADTEIMPTILRILQEYMYKMTRAFHIHLGHPVRRVKEYEEGKFQHAFCAGFTTVFCSSPFQIMTISSL